MTEPAEITDQNQQPDPIPPAPEPKLAPRVKMYPGKVIAPGQEKPTQTSDTGNV
jgi:hypothetical protein